VEETNLSKVFKDNGSFTPQNILEGNHDPVWEEISNPIEKISSKPAEEPLIEEETDQTSNEEIPDPPQSTLKPVTPQTAQPIESDTTSTISTSEGVAPSDILHEQVTIPEPEDDPPPSPEPVPEPIDLESFAQEHFERGYQECLKNVDADYISSTKALTTACTEINNVRETILNNSIGEMQALVFKIAEKILRISVKEQNETIVHTVEEAIRRAVKSDEFVIQLNPADYDIIKEKSQDFINSFSGLENIVIKPDASIEVGGCMIESSNCTVDATIEVQLDMIKSKVNDNS
jgi:flagellar assembly protein FliH